ncbi:hypothetical protein GIB67_001202 [Kingdonia uniflora]|uniref:Uncharacterized protein n=1 Tax=Kingdonia uniflora TaxID=39325 RepID=A0A7J7LGI9_9MAGN|nr:hypothetical protein GIB67_001202 [Kingdonia uniflora]
MPPYIIPAALHEIRQVGFLDCKQFGIGEERETYASYWAEQTLEVGHLLADFQRMGNIDLFGPLHSELVLHPWWLRQRRFIACPRTSVCLASPRGQTLGGTWSGQGGVSCSPSTA